MSAAVRAAVRASAVRTKPKFFDYKQNTVYIYPIIQSPPTVYEVECELGEKLIHGDIVNFGKYLYNYTYFVVVNGDEYSKEFVRNPDLSHRGYLTIPYEVTHCIENAFEFYADIIDKLGSDITAIYVSKNDFYLDRFPLNLIDEHNPAKVAWYFGNTFMKDYYPKVESFIIYNTSDGFTHLEVEVKKKYMLKIERDEYKYET